MRIVKEADNKISKLWDIGKVYQKVYRMMTYVITISVDDGTLLYNMITGEMILIDREEMKNISSLPCSYGPWMDGLIQKHFLVKKESDDKNTVDSLRIALRAIERSNNITSYTILPTTNCNARCFYCYESGCKHESMSDETADKLVRFIDEHRGGKTINIHWFGGEPLVGIRQIDRICKTLREEKIPFNSAMISNGYLFDEMVAKRAKTEWNLKRIQITLDGTEKVYNNTKAYISACESPYKRVLDNIGILMANKIHVSIRLNLGMHNYEDLSVLIDELGKRFEDKTYLGAYVDFLFEDCGFEPTHFSESDLDLLYEKKEELENQIYGYADTGVARKLPRLVNNCCMTDNDSSVVVVPSGMLGKCEHYIDNNFVGSLETGISEPKEVERYAERAVFLECAACPIYPACIKLRVCQKNTCSKRIVREKTNNIVRNMRLCYGDYLRKILPKETDCDEEPNC